MVVVFKKGGKSYSYNATTYQKVLEKLGFNILYKHNVCSYKTRIKQLQKEIDAGGFESLFAIDDNNFIKYTPEDIEAMKKEIKSIEEILINSIVC